MQTSIEFHDSTLSACTIQHKMLVIELRPAYVHKWEMVNAKWIGTGWVQNSRITIDKATISQKLPAVPTEISDGMITIGSTAFDNLVTVPFSETGPCRLVLHLVNGEILDASGGSLNITLQGDSKYVESLPDEWAPNNLTNPKSS